MGVEAGLKSEDYFRSTLNKLGLPYEYIDDWYDFKVCGQKVEVKSCRISNHNGKTGGITIGRFDFTNKENRESQFNSNCWVCLIIRHRDNFFIYGFIRARQMNMQRYLSIHKAWILSPLSLEEWVKVINQ